MYRETIENSKCSSTAEAVASSACSAIFDKENIGGIVVLTETGKLARLVAKYRPKVPILACSPVERVVRQMNCIRGVQGK